jgi:hypothetical protein
MAMLEADRLRDDDALPNQNDPEYRRLLNTLRLALQRVDYDLGTHDQTALQPVIDAMDAITAYVQQHKDWT